MKHTFTLGGAPQPRFYGFSYQNERIPFLRRAGYSGPSLPRMTGWVGLRRRSKFARSVLYLGAEPQPGNSSEGSEGGTGGNPLEKMLGFVKDGYKKGASIVAKPIIGVAMKKIQEGESVEEPASKFEQRSAEERPSQVMQAGKELADTIRKMGGSKTEPDDGRWSQVASIVDKGYKLAAIAAAKSVIALGRKSVKEVIRAKQETARMGEEKGQLDESLPDAMAAVKQDEKQDAIDTTMLGIDKASAEDVVEGVSEELQAPLAILAADQGESLEGAGAGITMEAIKAPSETVDSSPGFFGAQSDVAAVASDKKEGLEESVFEASSEAPDSLLESDQKPERFATIADAKEPMDASMEGEGEGEEEEVLFKDALEASSDTVEATPDLIQKPLQFSEATTEEEEAVAKDVLETSAESADLMSELVEKPDQSAAAAAAKEEVLDSPGEDPTAEIFKTSSECDDAAPDCAPQLASMAAGEDFLSVSAAEKLADDVLKASSDTVETTTELVEVPEQLTAAMGDQNEPLDAVKEDSVQGILDTASDTTLNLVDKPDQLAAAIGDQNESLDAVKEDSVQGILDTASDTTLDLVYKPDQLAAAIGDQNESLDAVKEDSVQSILETASDLTLDLVEEPEQFAAITSDQNESSGTAEENLTENVLEASSDPVEPTSEVVNSSLEFAAVAADQDEPSDAAETVSSDSAEPMAQELGIQDRFTAVTADEGSREGAGDATEQASTGQGEMSSSSVLEAGFGDPVVKLEQSKLEVSMKSESDEGDAGVDANVLAAQGDADSSHQEGSESTGPEVHGNGQGDEGSPHNNEPPEELETTDSAQDKGASEEQNGDKTEIIAEGNESVGDEGANDTEEAEPPVFSGAAVESGAQLEGPHEGQKQEEEHSGPEVVSEGADVESHAGAHNKAVNNHEGDVPEKEPEKGDEAVKGKDEHRSKEESTNSVFAKAVNAGIEVADGAAAEEPEEEDEDEPEKTDDSKESKTTSEKAPTEKDPDDKATDESSPKQPTKSALQVSAIRRNLKAEPPVNIIRPEKGEKYDRTVGRRGPALGGLGGLQYIRSYAESGKVEVEKGEPTNQYFTPPKILMGKEVNSGKVEASTGSDAVTRTQQIQDIGTIWWQNGDDSGGGGGGGSGGGGPGGHGGSGEGGWWLQVLISLMMITGVVFAVLKAVLKPKERNAVNDG